MQSSSIIIIWFVSWFLLVGLSIVAQLFLAMAVYQDARSHYNSNALMWALLIGFLGLIPGIVYLCIRKKIGNTPVVCPHCGLCYAPFSGACPRCSAPNPTIFMDAYSDLMAAHKKAKTYLTVAIVLWGSFILLTIILVVALVATAVGSAAVYY